MVITMSLIVFGALGSAIMTTGYGNWIWQSLVAWRFILGIGVGGTYPLTAVMAGEMNDDRGLGRTRRVALSIAVQIVGNILAPVLMFLVLVLLGTDRVTQEPWATELGWRFLLGAGALPGVFALREIITNSGTDAESNEYLDARASGGIGKLKDVINVISGDNVTLRRRLMGTAGAWAAFDACFFGVAIFLPHIVHDLIDKNDEAQGFLMLNALVSAVINCIAIPAALLSFKLVGDDALGRKNLQALSFLMISTAYSVLMFFFSSLRAIEATTAIIVLFSALFFCLNFGAGVCLAVARRTVSLSLSLISVVCRRRMGCMARVCELNPKP
jgi:PHS family inorganic phosphate transporter-like MFS transporter